MDAFRTLNSSRKCLDNAGRNTCVRRDDEQLAGFCCCFASFARCLVAVTRSFLYSHSVRFACSLHYCIVCSALSYCLLFSATLFFSCTRCSREREHFFLVHDGIVMIPKCSIKTSMHKRNNVFRRMCSCT